MDRVAGQRLVRRKRKGPTNSVVLPEDELVVKRPGLIALLIAAVVAVVALVFTMRSMLHKDGDPGRAPAAAQNITVTIDDQKFDLKDGVAEKPAAPGSATRNTLRVVGEAVSGDADGDGKPDAALLLQNDPGGSGTFYYAVLAVNEGNGTYRATNALALGDRIVPQGVEFTDGHFVYSFLERKPEEPLAAEPTSETRVPIHLEGDRIRPGL